MRRRITMVLLACCLAACGDSGPSDPVCNDNVRQGTEVCDGTDLGGQTCEGLSFEGGDLACADTCDAFDTTGCEGCADECATAGETQCRGTAIETCTQGADTCKDWVAGVDCANTDERCDDSAEPALCLPPCMDECATAGDTECSGAVIQTCTLQADGCKDWVAGLDCSTTAEPFCDDSAEPAVCVVTCVDQCDTLDDTRCNGTIIQTCTPGSDTCTDWVDGVDCEDNGRMCNDAVEPAICSTFCEDDCPTEGETHCNVNVIQTCTRQPDGCRDWVDTEDCADIDGLCDDSIEPAVCLPPCFDFCPAEGETQCNGTVIQVCTIQPSGCVDWENGQDCSEADQICDESTEPAVCLPP